LLSISVFQRHQHHHHLFRATAILARMVELALTLTTDTNAPVRLRGQGLTATHVSISAHMFVYRRIQLSGLYMQPKFDVLNLVPVPLLWPHSQYDGNLYRLHFVCSFVAVARMFSEKEMRRTRLISSTGSAWFATSVGSLELS
jgi:hypothetical protein